MKRILFFSFSVLILLAWGVSAVGADNATKTSTDLALGPGTIRDTVSYAGDSPGWTIYFRPGVRFSNHDRLITYFDFLVPLYYTDKSVLFFNPKINFDNNDNVEWNVGMGYRHLLAGDRLILGGNLFYDGRKSYTGNDFHQIGVGAEVLTEWVNARVNGYISLSDAKESGRWREYYFGSTSLNYSLAYGLEEPMSGLDYEVGFKVPGLSNYVETWVYAGGYNYFSDYTDDMAGWSTRVEVIPTDFVKVDFSVRDDNLRDTEYAGEVVLELPFSIDNLIAGKDPFEGIGDVFKGSRTMKERLYEQVRRDIDITINTIDHTRATTPTEVIPGEVVEDIVYVDNSNTSGVEDGSLEHPWNTLEEGLADSRVPDSWVFVFRGDSGTTPYSGIFTLEAGTTLWGEGYDLYNMGFTGYPEITGASISPNGVLNLASNSTVMGLGISTTNNYKAIFGDGVTNISIHDNLIHDASLGIYLRDSLGTVSGIDITDNVISLSHSDAGSNCYAVYFAGKAADIDILNNELTANITLSSYSWNDAVGIIFTHNYDPNSASDIDGLRIIGNTISTRSVNGHYSAGILIDAGAYGGGSGITWAYNGSTLRNFTIADNTISTDAGRYGAGIDFGASSNGVIQNNTITVNGGYYSWGIGNYNYPSSGTSLGSVTGVTIDGNTITVLNAGSCALGFDLWAYDSDMTISNNVVTLSSTADWLVGANIATVGGTENYVFTGNTFTGTLGGAANVYGFDIFNYTGTTTLGVSLAGNTISGFDTGVWLESGLTGYTVDLGGGTLGSTGHNSITGFTGYAVNDSTGISPGVIARYNWWGGNPVSTWFNGTVDYSNPLTSEP